MLDQWSGIEKQLFGAVFVVYRLVSPELKPNCVDEGTRVYPNPGYVF